jgi:peptidoglycan-associated lipoprotein
MRRMTGRALLLVTMVLLVALIGACAKKPASVARPMPPPPDVSGTIPPPPPPEPVSEPVPVPPEPMVEDKVASKSIDDLNRESPLRPVFFPLDSSEVAGESQAALQANAQVLRQYPSWQVTIEGHCDERGTAEYNLALGERRAIAAKTYLVSLGIPGERVRTVSYGKEFPFDPGHDEAAWSKNRRAHFVVTAK